MQFVRSRWSVRVALGAATITTLILVLFWRPVNLTPSRARLQSVEVGMTKGQVREVVGVVPGDYPRGADLFHRIGVIYGKEVWRCPEGELHVWYDADGRVADSIVYLPGVAPPDRFLFRLRSR